ncbi:MAG: M67 family metallopeptidase [Gemmatimonadota bacterium]
MMKPTNVGSPPAVSAPASVLSALRRLAGAARPQEACGALLGRCEYGVWWEIATIITVPNAASSPEKRFLIPAEIVRSLERAALDSGLQLVGFFHSHPQGGACASATDNALAWPGYLYGIVDALSGDLRFWTLDPDRATLLEVRTTIV